jgi:hypothetical protein
MAKVGAEKYLAKVRPIAQYRNRSKREVQIARNKSASETIGAITKGSGFTAITAGHWDMISAVKHVLSEIGPADVWISTWIPAMQEIVDLKDMIAEGQIRKIKLLIDIGFVSNREIHAAKVMEWIGAENIVTARNHSKMALFRNEHFDYCLRGSLNLNANNRCENIDGDESKSMVETFLPLWEEYAAVLGNGLYISNHDALAAHKTVMGVKIGSNKPKTVSLESAELNDFLLGLD